MCGSVLASKSGAAGEQVQLWPQERAALGAGLTVKPSLLAGLSLLYQSSSAAKCRVDSLQGMTQSALETKLDERKEVRPLAVWMAL